VPGAVPAATVTETLNDVEVTFVGVPTVAPGIVVVTFSPLTKLLPLTTTTAVVPFGMVLGVSLLMAGCGSMVRQAEQVADPPGVVTVTSPAPSIAVVDSVIFAVIEVGLM